MSLTKVNIPGLHGGISQQSPHLRMQNQHTSVVNAECNLLDGIRFPRNTTIPHRSADTDGSLGVVKTTDGKDWLMTYDGLHVKMTDVTAHASSATQMMSVYGLSYFTGTTAANFKYLNLLDTVFLLNTNKSVSTVTKAYPSITMQPFILFKIPEVLVGQNLTLACYLKAVETYGGLPAGYTYASLGGVIPASTDTIYTVATALSKALCGLYTEASSFKEVGILTYVSATVTSAGHTFRAIVPHTASAGNAPVIGGNAYWTDLGATDALMINLPAWASGATYFTAADWEYSWPTLDWDYNNITTAHPVERMSSVNVTNPFGNLNLYVVKVGSYEKLPAELPLNMNGVVFSPADGYFVTWDAVKRKYVECTAPAQQVSMVNESMPYKLSYTLSTGLWSLSNGGWEDYPRLVGDSDSAPLPDIVSKKINHMFYHRNRLCFLAEDFVVMSRANEPYKFFPQTATEVLDDDPISVRPSSVGYHKLLHAEPANKQLYLFAENKQYILHSGYDALTPKTVAMDETTAYRLVESSIPLQLEDSMVLLINNGSNVGLVDYKVSDTEYATSGKPLTEQCPRLIPYGYNKLAYASAAKALFVWAIDSAKVFMLRMHKNTEGQLVQLAWQELNFPFPIKLLQQRYGDELWICYGDTLAGTAPVSKLPLDKDTWKINEPATAAAQTLAIDITNYDYIAGGTKSFTAPGSAPIGSFVAIDWLSGVPCDITSTVGRAVTFSNPMYEGSPRPIMAGFTVSGSEVELSPLVLRDDNGLPENNQEATIARLEVNWTGGEFTVAMEGEAMPSRTVDVMPRSFVPGSHTPGGSYLEVEPTKITVMYPAGRCKIKLRHKGTIPTKINNISYELDVHRK